MTKESSVTLRARYSRLETARYVFLQRARQCSELTIPTLVPPLGHTATTKYYTPWQGIGARGVNNLASKLLLALFPPNAPFFKLAVDDFTVEELSGGDANGRAKIDEGLNKVERSIQNEIEQTGLRSPAFLALKHAIVAGNVAITLPKEGMRVFCLDSYVVQRDPQGNLTDFISKEVVSPDAIDADLLALLDTPEAKEELAERKTKSVDKDGNESDDGTIEIYTRYYLEGDTIKSYQELNGGIRVPQSEGSWPKEKSPLIVLRWNHVAGEDYGRSYVEEYLGDLISLEGLSKAIVEAAAATSKIVFLISPNGVTKVKDITEAESGAAVIGHKDDVHCLQADKQADMRIAADTVKTISERLSYAFLLNSAVQRQAERVTAEEVRFMANELESALGGVYSILSQEFQLPFVNRVMARMQQAKRLPKLPDKIVKPSITTGLEALGRGQELSKYMQLAQFIQQAGPAAQAYLNMGDLLKRVGTALLLDTTGLIKSEDQIQQERQQAQQAQMGQNMSDIAGKAAPAVVKAVSDHAMAGRAAPSGN